MQHKIQAKQKGKAHNHHFLCALCPMVPGLHFKFYSITTVPLITIPNLFPSCPNDNPCKQYRWK